MKHLLILLIVIVLYTNGISQQQAFIKNVPDYSQPPTALLPSSQNISNYCAPFAFLNIVEYWDVIRAHPYANGLMAGLTAPETAEYIGWFMDTNNQGSPARENGATRSVAQGTYMMDQWFGAEEYLLCDAQNTFLFPYPVPAPKKQRGWDVQHVPIAEFMQFKEEIDAGNPVKLDFKYWNILPTADFIFDPLLSEDTIFVYDWGSMVNESFMVDERAPIESWNLAEGDENIGHAVTAVGYLENYRQDTSYVIVHDNWAYTPQNIAVPWLDTKIAGWFFYHLPEPPDFAVTNIQAAIDTSYGFTDSLLVNHPVAVAVTAHNKGTGAAINLKCTVSVTDPDGLSIVSRTKHHPMVIYPAGAGVDSMVIYFDDLFTPAMVGPYDITSSVYWDMNGDSLENDPGDTNAINDTLSVQANVYSLADLKLLRVPYYFTTIQQAIDAASDGHVILVDQGTYYENINFKGKAITVASRFYLDDDTSHISKTIINGSQPSNPDSGSVVFFIYGEDTTSVLCGFTVTEGTGTVTDLGFPGKGGGGIYLVDASAKISNNKIINNSVTNDIGTMGGGLLSGPAEYDGFIVIENNLFESNYCYGNQILAAGGGMLLAGSARVSNNTFKNNLISSTNGEAFGAGLSCAQNMDSVIINQNIVINNKAETFFGKDDVDAALGGGIMIFYDHTASIRIMNNIIAGNEVSGDNWTAAAGIGIEDVMGEILFANNLVYDNFYSGSVDCHGTGICVFDNTEVKIINNTIFGNEASLYGGGLTTWKTISTVAINNIFWGNSSGASMKEVEIWEGKAPEIVYSNVQGGWDDHDFENHNWNLEPKFTDVENGDFHLMEGSPGIGWGLDSTIVPKTDFYGNIRPHTIDFNVDMGAIESPYEKTTIVAVENEADKLPTAFALKQNYPNPFNPVTNIEYQLPKLSQVDLSIYNLLGQKVMTLVSKKQPAGSYKVEWDASDFSSGVYLYRLKTDNGSTQTYKLVILK